MFSGFTRLPGMKGQGSEREGARDYRTRFFVARDTNKIHEKFWRVGMIDGQEIETANSRKARRSSSVWFTRLRGADKSPITLYGVLTFNRVAGTETFGASGSSLFFFSLRHRERARNKSKGDRGIEFLARSGAAKISITHLSSDIPLYLPHKLEQSDVSWIWMLMEFLFVCHGLAAILKQ